MIDVLYDVREPVLDELYASISKTIRGRRPDEAPFEVGDGYVKLQFAYGYHRLGNERRALELEAAGHAQLAAHRDDPIHAWLIDAFAARIRGDSLAALDERLDALERVTRFKVDMFREASWMIGGENVDAAGHFGRVGRPFDLAESTRAFHERVDRAFALADEAEEPDQADAYIEFVLQIRPDSIEPRIARSVLDRVLPRIEGMGDRRRLAHARAIALAVHAAPERVPGLVELIAPLLEPDSWNLVETMRVLSTALTTELSTLWPRLPASVHDSAQYLTGLLRSGVMPDLRELLHAAAASDHEAQLLRVAMLDSFLARPLSERFTERWAGDLFGTAADERSTNSHFSYAAIYVVDRIVRGVLE